MTDLEIARLCADAMGIKLGESNGQMFKKSSFEPWNPLTNDAQAMALLKRFCKALVKRKDGDWSVNLDGARNADLNRAICECVAKLSLASKARA